MLHIAYFSCPHYVYTFRCALSIVQFSDHLVSIVLDQLIMKRVCNNFRNSVIDFQLTKVNLWKWGLRNIPENYIHMYMRIQFNVNKFLIYDLCSAQLTRRNPWKEENTFHRKKTNRKRLHFSFAPRWIWLFNIRPPSTPLENTEWNKWKMNLIFSFHFIIHDHDSIENMN